MTRTELSEEEYHPYYARYILKLPAALDLMEGFELGLDQTPLFFQQIPAEKMSYRYRSGSWSIKEVLQHLIDTERIFMYRCFRIARRDTTSLAGFDQEVYMEPSQANSKSMDQLLQEYQIGRRQSINFLHSIRSQDLAYLGQANGHAMSARAAAFIIIGHDIWHLDILKEKYL